MCRNNICIIRIGAGTGNGKRIDEYDGKPFVITLEVGAKLKYHLVDGKAIIVFDEAYCVYNDVAVEKPVDFDPSQYTETTLRQLNSWEKADSGENGTKAYIRTDYEKKVLVGHRLRVGNGSPAQFCFQAFFRQRKNNTSKHISH